MRYPEAKIGIERKQLNHGQITAMTAGPEKAERWITFFSVLILCVLVKGCRTSEPVFSDAPLAVAIEKTRPAVEPPVLRVGDLVVFHLPDAIHPHEERIKEDGTITLPLIGSIVAAGKTTLELQRELTGKYPGLSGWHRQQDLFYYVGGEVRSPGARPYLGDTTVSKAIEAAGGFTESASRRNVRLLRGDSRMVVVIKLGGSHQDPDHDPQVFPGDSITVKRRGLFARWPRVPSHTKQM